MVNKTPKTQNLCVRIWSVALRCVRNIAVVVKIKCHRMVFPAALDRGAQFFVSDPKIRAVHACQSGPQLAGCGPLWLLALLKSN